MIWLVKIEAKQKCTVREKGVVKSSEVRRPCPDSYLQVFTRGKHWLFTLFLLLLPFWRANRRLIVNAVTGAHPSLISGNTKGKAGYRYAAGSPLLPASGNANRRSAVDV